MHTLDAPAGQPCEACAPIEERRRYLIVAGRNVYGAHYACGHYHAEHHTDDLEEARRLVSDLAARHAAAELLELGDMGERSIRAIMTGDWRADAAPCCQPAAGPYGPSTQPGARCAYCGDPWTQWTKASAA